MGEVPLNEYFRSEEHEEEVFAAIRVKVVGVMLSARCPGSGGHNFVPGLDRRIGDLVDYVEIRIRGTKRVFGHTHLPKHKVSLSRREWDVILRRIHREIITAILVVMRDDNSLWYQDGDWCFSQVIRLEHDRLTRERKQAWNDRRTFHGRPSNQGRRRARSLRQAPGVSVGGQPVRR